MLIWSGRGILIPVFGVLGMIVGSFAGGLPLLFLKLDPGTHGKWAMVFSMLGAAAALWIFGKTIGKTKEQALVDPRTQQQVLLTTKHTLFFLPAKFWSVVAGILALVMVFRPTQEVRNSAGAATSIGASAFRDANDLLIGQSKGIVHGNTPAATALAEVFSQTLKQARAAGIAKRSKNPIISLTKGEFLTYCLLTQRRCVFMVHVPDLRKFTADAKDFIAEAAWHIAVSSVNEAGIHPTTVAVGIRGSLLYDRAIVGHPGDLDDAMTLIERTLDGDSDSREELTLQFAAIQQDEQKAPLQPASKPEAKTTASMATPAQMASPAPAAAATPQPPPAAKAPSAAATVKPLPVEASAAPAGKPIQPLNDMRTWKDATGRSMQAAFIRFTSEDRTSAEFKREDGNLFTVALTRLDPDDQNFILHHPDLAK